MKSLLTISFLIAIQLAWRGTAQAAPRPNFVVILADDLGYGDLGCYGNTRHRTPHLDQLAAEGIRFTDFHSNGPMCTPTRAALLTGFYQHRFGKIFESALGGRAGQGPGLPLEAFTLAEALREAGYATGLFGKWHLGYEPRHLPTRQGFDEFRGLVSGDGDHHTQIDRSGGLDWWFNEQITTESGYTADLLTRHSIDFIERHRDRPFFLYLPHLAIHFPWQGPEDPPHRRPGKEYHDDKWGLLADPHQVAPHVRAMVEALDRSVGEMMAALRRLQLDQNTLVLFLSDNGGYVNYGESHRNISSNGPLRGQKGQLYEGGHRVPALAWWPGRLQPGVSYETVMTFDLFPTLLRLAGGRLLPVDGLDLIPHLLEGRSLPERDLFWRMRDERAVRRGPWKLVQHAAESPQLFNLSTDLGETRNLAAAQPRLVHELSEALARWEKEVEPPAASPLPPPPPDENAPGPWDQDVLVFRAGQDNRAEMLAVFERAGVPTAARLRDGRILAAHQNFPKGRGPDFDKVAVRFSADEGRTWTGPEVIQVDGFPDGMRFPFDPTLVPLPDGRVRLYFTSRQIGRFEVDQPAIYSAVSGDGINYQFEPGVRFAVEGRLTIDCAAALHDGVFHLYVPDNGKLSDRPFGPPLGEPIPSFSGYHAMSRDGLHFERVEDVVLPRGNRWLGNLQSDAGQLVFFGTGRGPWPMTSADGHHWKADESPVRVPGPDPGAVRLRDGSWLLVVTGPPRPGTPSALRRGPVFQNQLEPPGRPPAPQE